MHRLKIYSIKKHGQMGTIAIWVYEGAYLAKAGEVVKGSFWGRGDQQTWNLMQIFLMVLWLFEGFTLQGTNMEPEHIPWKRRNIYKPLMIGFMFVFRRCLIYPL